MSWALDAIEKEALARAFEQIRRTPQPFSYLGYNEDQIRMILLRLESKALILPNLTAEKISANLDERVT